MDIKGSLIFLVVMLLFVNFGGIIRLGFFNRMPWKELKWVLLIANILLFAYVIVYFLVLKKG